MDSGLLKKIIAVSLHLGGNILDHFFRIVFKKILFNFFSKFTREYLMDECSKTFCFSDRVSKSPSRFNLNMGHPTALSFLNEVYERGSLNPDFSFVSSLNLGDVQPYSSFFQNNYLGKSSFKPSKLKNYHFNERATTCVKASF